MIDRVTSTQVRDEAQTREYLSWVTNQTLLVFFLPFMCEDQIEISNDQQVRTKTLSIRHSGSGHSDTHHQKALVEQFLRLVLGNSKK